MSFNVDAGERVAIIGPNGAGKTTLFNILNGQLRATSGSVSFLGRDITRMSIHGRAHNGIARSFQIVNLFLESTVLDNAVLAAQGTKPTCFRMIRPIGSYNEICKKAEELLKSFMLWDLKDESVNFIAYGDQRKHEIHVEAIEYGEKKLKCQNYRKSGWSSQLPDAPKKFMAWKMPNRIFVFIQG